MPELTQEQRKFIADAMRAYVVKSANDRMPVEEFRRTVDLAIEIIKIMESK